MKIKLFIGMTGLLILAACNADIEPIEQRYVPPQEQDPAAYAAYVEALRSYKQSDHYLMYASMDNAPEVAFSEKNFLRSMPDSLDMVGLRNPLSAFDLEDLPVMQGKGTRILLYADCSDLAMAEQTVDNALASIETNGLDGIVILYTGPVDDLARTTETAIAGKLAALGGKTVLFEGNASFVAAENIAKYDYYLHDATKVESYYELWNDIAYMAGYLGIPLGKILPAVKLSGIIIDPTGAELSAVTQVAHDVITNDLAGVAIYNISEDYYGASSTYPRVRDAIYLLNPSYVK